LAKDIMENQNKVVFHGKRADGIVKSMLQHSRNNSNVKEKMDINTLAEECIRLSYHGLRAKDKTFNAKMELRLSENLPAVLGVSGDISRVLLNMCTNAFYAVMKKSRFQISGYQPEVILTTGGEEDKVWIQIEDNGEGISDENIEKIFQPFFTTKPTGEGTGLGLSMSYEIITKGHQGQIKVSSEEGVGTTFTIELPSESEN
jgi:signal transduction histidine kinase